MTDEAQKCYEKYHANAAFARKLEDEFADETAWSCVVRFYAALHLINAYLIDKKNVRFDPKTAAHVERKRAMERCPELRDAPHRFRELKDMSERFAMMQVSITRRNPIGSQRRFWTRSSQSSNRS
jgi:hypothetical protein